MNHQKGLNHIVEDFRQYLDNGLVKEGLQKITKHFETEKSVGPTFVADFEEITDPEEREIKERDAYERIDQLLKELGV